MIAMRRLPLGLTAGLLLCAGGATAGNLPDLIAATRPSIVGVGTFIATRAPQSAMLGTGFVVGDGLTVLTNAHVVASDLDSEHQERFVVFVGRGKRPSVRKASVLQKDRIHDLAVLRIDGEPVPALAFADTGSVVREGQTIAFTGFPIGAILGLYPVTHTGIISSIPPIAIPQASTKSLTAAQIRRLREPFEVYQLDAVAYPGNSGSPLFDLDSGRVIGIINSVLAKESKESLLKDPSAISYAIPIEHARRLLAAP